MKALLIDAWAALRARRGAAAVVTGGLLLAQAAALLGALVALAFAELDPAVPEPGRVVLLDFKGNIPGRATPWLTAGPVVMGPLLRERALPLERISRTALHGIDFDVEGRIEPALLVMADPDAAPLLGWASLAGDLPATLVRRDGIALSASLVARLWGALPPAQAVGRTLSARGLAFTVGAVVPDADPRGLFADANPMVGRAMAVVGFDSQGNDWSEEDRQALFMANGRVLARLKPGTEAAQVGPWMREAFVSHPGYAKLPAEWRSGREAAYFRALPLSRLPFEGELNAQRWSLLAALGAAALLLLLLAALNAMNLQAATLLQRQRETALRRSLGAGTTQLLSLWATELALQLLAAAAGAALLAWWLAPAAAQALGLPPAQAVADPLPAAAWAGLAVAGALLLVLVLAVPAAAALRRAPAPALQGRTASEGPWGSRVRQGLLALQLTGATVLAALAAAFAVQHHHLLNADRGYRTENRLWLGMMMNPEQIPAMGGLVQALSSHPAISHWAFSSSRPAGDTRGQTELYTTTDRHQAPLRVTRVSPGFFDTWGMRWQAGAARLGAADEPAVVIDGKAARRLGFAAPEAALGALLRAGGGYLQEGQAPRRVVGVVADVKLESGRDGAEPQAFVITDRPQWDLTVTGPDPRALQRALDDIWQAHGPRAPHMTRWAGEQRAAVYRQEGVLTAALVALAALAVGVAGLGAYALAADTLRRRRRELVLHRLHGAGDGAVARRVAAEFAAPLAVALAVAVPVAALLAEAWGAGFVDRAGALAGVAAPVAAAALLTLLAVALAAARHTRMALQLRPAEALG